MDLQREFGRRVRELRTRRGLTQKQLGQKCGETFATQRIGEIERGNMKVTLQTSAGLCRGLRCEPLELFLFGPGAAGRKVSLPDARLADLWAAADEQTKSKLLRVLRELL